MNSLHRIARAFDKFGMLFDLDRQFEILLALSKQIWALKVRGFRSLVFWCFSVFGVLRPRF
jgi:hypothetical protein